MTYTEAKREFDIRLYRWARPILLREIAGDFPSFKLCKTGPAQPCRFFRKLTAHEKVDFADGLLQRRHAEAVKALNEPISTAGLALLNREVDFWAIDPERFWLSPEDEKRVVKARQLRKAMSSRFKAAFGSECLPRGPLDGKGDLVYRMPCRGWIIRTWFFFGRWGPEISYFHNIWTGKWITREEPEVLPANCIGFGDSYGNTIGIGTCWDYLFEEDVEPACAAVIEHCSRFFEAAPKLLDGLELETLTT